MAFELISQNVARIQERVTAAARRAGRRPEEITLIGVSKTHPGEAIRAAYDAGLRHFGENRVQEWEGKQSLVGDLNAVFHLIGHLQSNKAARAAKLFQSVDSVDDFPLAQRLARFHVESNRTAELRILIEVHIGDEQSKSGISPAELPVLAKDICNLSGTHLAGLMCIPPFFENAEKARPYFLRLRTLRDELAKRLRCELPVLSMGMSHDFEVAIEEGATEVRIGTAIFGTREAIK